MNLIYNNRRPKQSNNVLMCLDGVSPKNAHPRESRKLARELYLKKCREDRPRKKLKLCFETPLPSNEAPTFSEPTFKTPVADFPSKVTFSTRFRESPSLIREESQLSHSDSEFNLSPIRVFDRAGSKSFISPIIKPRAEESKWVSPGFNNLAWPADSEEISPSTASTRPLVNKLVFNPKRSQTKSIPNLAKKLGEPSEPSSRQSCSNLELGSKSQFFIAPKPRSKSVAEISSILPRLRETNMEPITTIFERKNKKRQIKPCVQPGGGTFYGGEKIRAVPQSAVFARSVKLPSSNSFLTGVKSECRFNTEGKVGGFKSSTFNLLGRSRMGEVSKFDKGEDKFIARSRSKGYVPGLNQGDENFFGERFKKKMSLQLGRIPSKPKATDARSTSPDLEPQTYQCQDSFFNQSAVFLRKRLQGSKAYIKYLKNIKNPGNVTLLLRRLIDTPSFFSRRIRFYNSPKSNLRQKRGSAARYWEGSSQGWIPRILFLMIIATLCGFVHDDYKIAEKKYMDRAQSRKSEAMLAYEKRCLLDNMTTVRKFSVYVNGVVSGRTPGGESNAIYDKECESLLLLLNQDNGDSGLYAPSIYLKELSATTVWNILGTVATAMACYNSDQPSLLILSFLFAAIFFSLGMLKDFVIDFPVLRWLWGVVPDA